MFKIEEYPLSGYKGRTVYNASEADLTIALALDLTTAGEILTQKAARGRYLGIDLTEDDDPIYIATLIDESAEKFNAKILNFAGNGISRFNTTQENLNRFMFDVILAIKHPFDSARSGGQTGIDLGSAVACYALGIPFTMTMPKYYVQRYKDGKDYNHTQEQILEMVEQYAKYI